MAWNYPAPPRRLKILHCDYAVRPITKAEAEGEHSDSYGFVSHFREEIALDPTLTPGRALETLLHEVLHCLWAAFLRYEGGKPDEERWTYRVGIGLATVLKDNPKLRAWIEAVSRSQP